jgi:hypothetical protein
VSQSSDKNKNGKKRVAKQKIKSVMVPESGIDLEPRGVIESLVETDFTRALSHIVGLAPGGPVVLRATSGGDLRVATVGIAYEVYDVHAGVAPDAYDVPNTFLYVDAQYVTDVLIENFGATIQFRDRLGNWGDGKTLPVGFYSFDFIHFGVRIQNRVALSVSNYEFTTYR